MSALAGRFGYDGSLCDCPDCNPVGVPVCERCKTEPGVREVQGWWVCDECADPSLATVGEGA